MALFQLDKDDVCYNSLQLSIFVQIHSDILSDVLRNEHYNVDPLACEDINKERLKTENLYFYLS